MDNQQVTDADLSWLAGLYEGDGSFGMNRRKRKGKLSTSVNVQPCISFTNCDRQLVEEVCEILTNAKLAFYVSYHKPRKRIRENWQVVISGCKRAIKLLPVMIPYLRAEKLEKATLLLEFCTSRLSSWHASPYSAREIEIFETLSSLNLRGRARNLRDYTPSSYSSKFRFTRS